MPRGLARALATCAASTPRLDGRSPYDAIFLETSYDHRGLPESVLHMLRFLSDDFHSLLALAASLPRLAAPQQQQWLPLVYTKTTDGFDDHDVGGPTAMCVNDGDVVRLKGTAQCKENVRSCWEKGNAMFATLPPGCGPVSASTVKLMKGPDASRPDAIPLGSEVEVGSDGTLTLVPKVPDSWELRLDGTTLPLHNGWGWTLVLVIAIGGALYVGGGVLHNHKVKQLPLGAAALPHREQWLALRGLVADGCTFTQARWQAYRAGAAASGGGYEPVSAATAASEPKTAATNAVSAEGAAAEQGQQEQVRQGREQGDHSAEKEAEEDDDDDGLVE